MRRARKPAQIHVSNGEKEKDVSRIVFHVELVRDTPFRFSAVDYV